MSGYTYPAVSDSYHDAIEKPSLTEWKVII